MTFPSVAESSAKWTFLGLSQLLIAARGTKGSHQQLIIFPYLQKYSKHLLGKSLYHLQNDWVLKLFYALFICNQWNDFLEMFMFPNPMRRAVAISPWMWSVWRAQNDLFFNKEASKGSVPVGIWYWFITNITCTQTQWKVVVCVLSCQVIPYMSMIMPYTNTQRKLSKWRLRYYSITALQLHGKSLQWCRLEG